MALTPLRKWLNVAFGLMLLPFVGLLLWPLIERPFELRSFCAELQPGASQNAIKALADQHGFRLSSRSEDVIHVYDIESLGKFSCALHMQGDQLSASSFSFGD